MKLGLLRLCLCALVVLAFSGCLPFPQKYIDCTISGHPASSCLKSESFEKQRPRFLSTVDRIATAHGLTKFGRGHTGPEAQPATNLFLVYRSWHGEGLSVYVTAEDAKSIPVIRLSEKDFFGLTTHTAESFVKTLHKELPDIKFKVQTHRYYVNDF